MRAVYYLSILLTILTLGISVWRGDWTWLLLSIIALVIVLLPAVLTKDFSKTYHQKMASILMRSRHLQRWSAACC